MFCHNCGKEIKEEAKFCSSCGAEVQHVIEKEPEQSIAATTEVKPDVKKGALEQVVSFVSIVGGFIIGKFLGLVVFLFIFAYVIGEWFPKWYLKRKHVSPTLVKWVIWSNVLTWLLPPLGIMTGFAALGFSNDFSYNRKKYKTIAIIGILASFLNALSGVLINL